MQRRARIAGAFQASRIAQSALTHLRWPRRSCRCAAVERRFDRTLALQATDLDVAENDFVTILGPSGCGKSTLLRIVAGLDRPTGGDVRLDGRRIDGPGADRGMVFQSYTLFPWLTVLDNV